MITPDHECTWTRRRESELSRHDGALIGWGLSRTVLEAASRRLSIPLSVARSGDPEDSDEAVKLGPWSGNIHDGCIVTVDSDDPRLVHALLGGILELHEFYLGGHVPPECIGRLVQDLQDGTTIRLRSRPRQRELLAKCHRYDAGWWERFRASFEPVCVAQPESPRR